MAARYEARSRDIEFGAHIAIGRRHVGRNRNDSTVLDFPALFDPSTTLPLARVNRAGYVRAEIDARTEDDIFHHWQPHHAEWEFRRTGFCGLNNIELAFVKQPPKIRIDPRMCRHVGIFRGNLY